MKTATLNFDLTIKTTCPYCKEELDLEENDVDEDYFFTRKFQNWLNNEPKADKVREKQQCFKCEKVFLLNKIER